MKIREHEVVPGLIAFLDHRRLHRSPGVTSTSCVDDVVDFKVRGFLCMATLDGHSVWSPLTTTWRPERLHLRQEWRGGGGEALRRGDVYLLDGANLYMGPTQAFINASACEKTHSGQRAHLTTEGLSAVNAEIAAQRSRRSSVGAR